MIHFRLKESIFLQHSLVVAETWFGVKSGTFWPENPFFAIGPRLLSIWRVCSATVDFSTFHFRVTAFFVRETLTVGAGSASNSPGGLSAQSGQVAPCGGQIRSKANGAIWWPYLELLQVAPSGSQICD